MLLTRPLGVTAWSIRSPLRGAPTRARRDGAGQRAARGLALDRLVSVQDYADFALTFAGIGKAAARRLSDGRRELVLFDDRRSRRHPDRSDLGPVQ